MTLAERARIATEARQEAARGRAQALRSLLQQGECLKRAAWRVGVSYRTAKRYKARAR